MLPGIYHTVFTMYVCNKYVTSYMYFPGPVYLAKINNVFLVTYGIKSFVLKVERDFRRRKHC